MRRLVFIIGNHNLVGINILLTFLSTKYKTFFMGIQNLFLWGFKKIVFDLLFPFSVNHWYVISLIKRTVLEVILFILTEPSTSPLKLNNRRLTPAYTDHEPRSTFLITK